ncbi:MAG: NYN domain-containing protein [Chloroflexi bacterium]|nr:NYN domain-containing protein [Chloroflexota bacterium]
MAEADHLASSTDVAMFIDWENMHGCIRGKANISALREVAESYGRLVLAKAYADWREHRFQQDSLVLYKIGVEPIYVPQAPAGGKNNVDVKLATDCIDFAYRYPNIGVCILVTGDGDFIHVATALRPLGKKVVVIAQSNNASSRFGDLVDTLLIYEQDVNPAASPLPAPLPQTRQMTKPQTANEVYQEIVEALHQEEGAPILLAHVKQKLIRAYGGFDQNDYGFVKFKAMIEAGAQAGYFALNTAGLRDWLTLPHKDRQTAGIELPDELDELFQEIVTMIEASNQARVLLTYVKQALIKKYGGFDESIYGYNRLKELMQEGERLGYFSIGKNDKEIDYVFLKGPELTSPGKKNDNGQTTDFSR